MDHREAGRYWNENAVLWTRLVRAGYDVYRDHLNTPAFMAMLPDVEGLSGLDVGCGEGHNTRLIALRGARLQAIDVSDEFIRLAREMENGDPLGIDYRVASAVEMPFPEGGFDFVVATMSLMDIPEPEKALAEVFRVIKPGGFFQFSITHPCFDTPHRRNLRNQDGLTYAIEVGDYFHNQEGKIAEWIFGSVPENVATDLPLFRIPRFTRTLSQWVNALVDTGFVLERIQEPAPDAETIKIHPYLQDASVVAYFLHVRVRKS